MQETRVQSLGREDSLEKEMTTSILALEIPRTEEPGGLQSMGSHRVPLDILKKEFIGPGLHLRPVCADRACPPLQWTLNSVLSACGNAKGRIRPPSGQGNLEEEKTDTNHPCLRTVSIGM